MVWVPSRARVRILSSEPDFGLQAETRSVGYSRKITNGKSSYPNKDKGEERKAEKYPYVFQGPRGDVL
jgi:hypothetical protein